MVYKGQRLSFGTNAIKINGMISHLGHTGVVAVTGHMANKLRKTGRYSFTGEGLTTDEGGC
jgi:hypothetical protein